MREKISKKEYKIVPTLQFIQNTVWKAFFGHAADGLERSTEDEAEYRLIENDPIVNKYMPVSKNQINCASFIGGILEGMLNSADLNCKVSAYFTAENDSSKTCYVIKFDSNVLRREAIFN